MHLFIYIFILILAKYFFFKLCGILFGIILNLSSSSIESKRPWQTVQHWRWLELVTAGQLDHTEGPVLLLNLVTDLDLEAITDLTKRCVYLL